MNDVLVTLSKIGIVPVVALKHAEDARPLGKALCTGGLPCAEVTFRTDCAEEAIKIMSEEYPDMVIGAGTVITTEQVDRAVAAGAKFIVSPGMDVKLVKYCINKKIPVMPGCATPSDVQKAATLGLDVVKVFPAEAIGGLKLIKAMAAPYTEMKFMPTGGINSSNLNEYLDFDRIIACGGSWMVDTSLLAADKFTNIAALTREAVNHMLGFKVKHIGINCADDAEAADTADAFTTMFGFPQKNIDVSYFCGKKIEVMKAPGAGTHGHIAVGCNSVERAVYHLGLRGIEFDMSTAKYDKDGFMTFVYIKGEFGGFAVHLTLNA